MMASMHLSDPTSLLLGFDRSAPEQAAERLNQALRVLELVPSTTSPLTPHPLIVLRAEIENAKRNLALVQPPRTARILPFEMRSVAAG